MCVSFSNKLNNKLERLKLGAHFSFLPFFFRGCFIIEFVARILYQFVYPFFFHFNFPFYNFPIYPSKVHQSRRANFLSSHTFVPNLKIPASLRWVKCTISECLCGNRIHTSTVGIINTSGKQIFFNTFTLNK